MRPSCADFRDLVVLWRRGGLTPSVLHLPKRRISGGHGGVNIAGIAMCKARIRIRDLPAPGAEFGHWRHDTQPQDFPAVLVVSADLLINADSDVIALPAPFAFGAFLCLLALQPLQGPYCCRLIISQSCRPNFSDHPALAAARTCRGREPAPFQHRLEVVLLNRFADVAPHHLPAAPTGERIGQDAHELTMRGEGP